MLITCCRIITYMLLCRYTLFRADEMKEVVWQATQARVDFHNRYWKGVSDKGIPWTSCGLWECTYLTFVPSITAKNFIHVLLHPTPACCLTAKQVLLHAWLTSFVAPTEHDLCGLVCKNFDPCTHWCNMIGAAQAMLHFVKGNGRNNNNKKDQLVLSSDDEDGIGSQSRLLLSHATPEPNSKRQQQYLSPSSPDDCMLRGGLAGLVAKGTLKMTMVPWLSFPMSFLMPSTRPRPRLLLRLKRRCIPCTSGDSVPAMQHGGERGASYSWVF